MGHAYYHAVSSARTFGGQASDYIDLHNWLDRHKSGFPDLRYRCMMHHSQGVFETESKFGVTITNSDGREVPVRLLSEAHILEDMAVIPTLADWLSLIPPKPWMSRPTRIGSVNRREIKP